MPPESIRGSGAAGCTTWALTGQKSGETLGRVAAYSLALGISMTTPSDAHLIRQAALGDAESIATLYDRHAPALLGVAMRILRARADAEDALHDVFVSLPRRAQQYAEHRGSVLAWLAIVVRNVSIDRVRRHGRAIEAERTVEAEPPPSAMRPDPERDAQRASWRERVRGVLAQLPDAQRSSLEAAFFEGLTYSQIAERDGVPLNTVKSRCARGMMAMRDALAAAGIKSVDGTND
jgi:RNA polymerase sigma-70 factor (ECF subfamily)